MKLIQKLQARGEFLFLAVIVLVFFALRLPSLSEPFWYGDEGIYGTIGQAISNGKLLYRDIWDNKPPLIYLIYAFFNSDLFSVKYFSLIFGEISVVVFYFLVKSVFQIRKIERILLVLFVFFLGTPFLEGNIANAENFILPFVLLAALGILNLIKNDNFLDKNKQKTIFYIGFTAGVAFLIKIVAIFDLAAFLISLIIIYFDNLKKLLSQIGFLITGFITPIILCLFYFLINNSLIYFINAVFVGNLYYVEYANSYITPFGLLLLKIILLLLSVGFIFYKRRSLKNLEIFVFLWLICSIFNVLFSGRPWPHYLLLLSPSFCLAFGYLINKKMAKVRLYALVLIFASALIGTSIFNFGLNNVYNVYTYYENFVLFLTDKRDLSSYQEYFDKDTRRDYELAQFIRSRIKSNEEIFIWGNNPQIYVLANKLPPVKYVAEYHMALNNNSYKELSEEIRKKNLRYVIILPETENFPFAIGNYSNHYNIKGADIYERVL